MPRAEPVDAADGRVRVVIEGVSPAVDGGRFAVKRVLGDDVIVEADCFTDGHDVVRLQPAAGGRPATPAGASAR